MQLKKIRSENRIRFKDPALKLAVHKFFKYMYVNIFYIY